MESAGGAGKMSGDTLCLATPNRRTHAVLVRLTWFPPNQAELPARSAVVGQGVLNDSGADGRYSRTAGRR